MRSLRLDRDEAENANLRHALFANKTSSRKGGEWSLLPIPLAIESCGATRGRTLYFDFLTLYFEKRCRVYQGVVSTGKLVIWDGRPDVGQCSLVHQRMISVHASSPKRISSSIAASGSEFRLDGRLLVSYSERNRYREL